MGAKTETATISMSGSSVLVALNSLLLKRLRLPALAESQEGWITHE